MIEGLGIDAVELVRIREVAGGQSRLAARILTPGEQEQWEELPPHRQVEYLAGRFAAKEAFAKAFGTGIGAAVAFKDVEVLTASSGRPVVTNSPHDGRSHVSITHTRELVLAEVILEK